MSKRTRAAAVVVNKDNQILVVKEKGNPRYSIPGGGINRGEPKMSAAVRELYEELKLSARRAEYLGRFEGQRAFQYVYKIEAPGRPSPDRKEIVHYAWWDERSDVPVQNHVRKIRDMLVKSKL